MRLPLGRDLRAVGDDEQLRTGREAREDDRQVGALGLRRLLCAALVFTVDMPVPGSRYRDLRSGLAGAAGMAGSLRRAWQAARRPGWAWDVGLQGRPHHLGNVAPVLATPTALSAYRLELLPSQTQQQSFARVEAAAEQAAGLADNTPPPGRVCSMPSMLLLNSSS